MKNLKSYKIFERTWDKQILPKNIIDDIMDISTDIIDQGFDVQYRYSGSLYRHPCLLIHKFKSGGPFPSNEQERFLYLDIKDFAKTIESYLNEFGYFINVLYRTNRDIMEHIIALRIKGNHEDDGQINSNLFRIDIKKLTLANPGG